ncbi:MAG: hypothetical protein U0670_18955 [Anaerolineae bacterium]
MRSALAVLLLVCCLALMSGAAVLVGHLLPSAGAITFESVRGGNADLYALDLGSETLVNLSHSPGDDTSAVWWPGGTSTQPGSRMVFASNRDGRLFLYLFDLDGRRFERLRTPSLPAVFGRVRAAWSPDGRWLAYDVVADQPYLYLIDTTDPDHSPGLIDSVSMARDLAWSPDSTRLTFSRARGQGSQLFLYAVASGQITPLAPSSSFVTSNFGAVWSPDGMRIAFLSDRDGSLQVYLMDADGSNVRALTNWITYLQSRPLWSLDGRSLSFAAELSNATSLVRLDVETGEITRLNSQASLDGAFLQTPDGTRLIFMRYGSAGYALFSIGTDGGSAHPLPIGAGDGSYPAWIPLGR